ncbi:hypothetical protein D918_05753 [Trichuris suis]|nr:hypothetical protein D918_05753 [Trichuris suis]
MNRNDDYEDRRIAHRRQVYIAFVLKFFIDTTVIQSARLIYSLERQGQNSTHYISKECLLCLASSVIQEDREGLIMSGSNQACRI